MAYGQDSESFCRARRVGGTVDGQQEQQQRAGRQPRRCWPFHLAVKPFYELMPKHYWEHAFYAFVPIWSRWVRSQPLPLCNVVQAIMGFGTEIFDRAEKTGALKVMECPNSHPTSYFGFWQRECDRDIPARR